MTATVTAVCPVWCDERAEHLADVVPEGEIRIHRKSFGDFVGVEFAEESGDVEPVVIDLYLHNLFEWTADDAEHLGRSLIAAAAFLRSIGSEAVR